MKQVAPIFRVIALAPVVGAGASAVHWLTKGPVAEIRRWAVTSQPPQGGWTLDRLVVDAAAAACLVVALCFAASTVLTLVSAYVGSAAPWLGRTARIIGPRWWRHFILVTCGLGFVPGLALAAEEPDTPDVERCGQVCSSGLSGLPLPDLPVESASRQRATSATKADASQAVIVRSGDSLWLIASSQLSDTATDAAIAHQVADLHRANRTTIGNDPDLIYPGQLLTPPGDSYD